MRYLEGGEGKTFLGGGVDTGMWESGGHTVF